ncbi:hypothetical protein V866_004486 [Kwoniella sp. B9012]
MGGKSSMNTSDNSHPLSIPSLRDNHRINDRRRGKIKSSRLTILISIYICLSLIGISISSCLFWLPLVLIPFIGIIALPAFASSLIVLVYAIPSLLYLLWAQEDTPNHVKGVFILLNPVQNLSISLQVLRCISIVLDILPRYLWAIGRWIIWENLKRQVDYQDEEPDMFSASPAARSQRGGLAEDNFSVEHPASSTHVKNRGEEGIFREFAEFNIPYAKRKDGTTGYLDIYFPQKDNHRIRQIERSAQSLRLRSKERSVPPPTTYSPQQAPDIDSPSHHSSHSVSDSPSSAILAEASQRDTCGPSSSTPFHSRHFISQTCTSSSSDRTTATISPASTPSLHSASTLSSDSGGHRVVVFIYDVGMIGFRPRKEWFCLLGAKLGEMGFLTVIPDITTYPSGGVEGMVIDVRHVLSWVDNKMHLYGGSPSSIYLMGHGLGGHLGFFTLCQEGIIRSRDARQGYLERLKGQQVELDLNGIRTWRGSNDEFEDEIPNGLRKLKIYGEEIKIPRMKGIILLSPVSDVIRQIRYESSIHLEHISPLRRSHGPSQTACMRQSLGHLLFASKRILEVDRLPEKVLITHGAQDQLVPLSSSHWLSELLYGLGIPAVFKPYKDVGHSDLITYLMKGFEDAQGEQIGKKNHIKWLESDLKGFIEET